MTDPTPLLARMPTGSTLHLHAVPPDDGHVNHPAEVAIFRVPSGPGGCMVWALYDGVWHPNLGERYALRLLMDAPRAAEPTAPVRVPVPLIAAARDATGLPSGEAVRKVLSEALTLGEQVRTLQDHITQLDARLTRLEGRP
jgi:hypothetical protein